MSLLNQVIKPKLPAGEYPIFISSYREVVNEKGGYLELTIALPDRVIRQNFFPKNVDYLGKSLRTQLGLEGEETLQSVLDQAIEADNLFGVISYNEYGMNLAFHKQVAPSAEQVEFS